MKILMTGFTPRGVGSEKLLYSYMSNTSVIIKGLRAAGHEVTQRIVDVGDTTLTSNYDLAMVAVSVPQSLSSRYLFGALWAAEQFGVERTKFFVDDWLMHQLASQFESGLRDPEKRFYSLNNRHCYDEAKKHTAIWVKWFRKLRYEPTQLLIPTFAWSKPRLLLPKLDKIQPVTFDPTPMALSDPEVFWGVKDEPHFDRPPMAQRQRAWVLAAMRDIKPWMSKQRFEWPVIKYGNKREGEQILTEKELVSNVYTRHTGVIGAPYPGVAGGGGWRARYIHAAVTKSVLFLDSDEGRAAGGPYNLFRSVVEAMDATQLEDLAHQQSAYLVEKSWTLDRLIGELNRYVSNEV